MKTNYFFSFASFALPLFFFSPQNSLSQTTITLQPGVADGKDAYLDGFVPDKNWGDHPELAAITWENSGEYPTARGIIQFDFSSIPPNAIIVSATLSLYWSDDQSNVGHSGANASYLCRVTQSWDEHMVTWNNQPKYTRKDRVYLPKSRTETQDYPNIDVTALVQDMVGIGNHGFLLRLKKEEIYRSMKFCSSDDPDPSKHPKLVITYTGGAPVGKDLSTIFSTITALNVYPNPILVSGATINFSLYKSSHTSIELFDLQGREIETLLSQNLREGNHQVPFYRNNLSGGIYFLRVKSDDGIMTKKVVVE